ncbi:hypothetical protein ACH5RR_015823 [Cinchona calisaya]|uniref:Uncharacterized protein n=1 Tax=Cinchona calisaya TaxID=153742 RepID=A0ABD2ZU96_9GENT
MKFKNFLVISLLVLSSYALPIFGASITTAPAPQYGGAKTKTGGCHNKAEALKLKLIAIFAILVTSVMGICLPLFSHVVPALHPDKDLFVLVKAFASGVILATVYMHVMPDSFDCLRSECLPENPRRKFPFTTFVAMLSALLTLMIDSFAMSYYKKCNADENVDSCKENQDGEVESQHFGHSHRNRNDEGVGEDKATQLLRHRVVAQVYM